MGSSALRNLKIAGLCYVNVNLHGLCCAGDMCQEVRAAVSKALVFRWVLQLLDREVF